LQNWEGSKARGVKPKTIRVGNATLNDLAPLAIGTAARTGPSQWLAEAVATFALVLAILGGIRYAPQAIPWLVGLTITAAYWFTSSTSFANPAVTLARGFTTTFAGIAINHVLGVSAWTTRFWVH
jgi:glycerol uptake facilitator-like aquaporin